MNPELRADGFLGSIVPRSAPVTPRFGGAGAARPTCISNTYLSCNGTAWCRLTPAISP